MLHPDHNNSVFVIVPAYNEGSTLTKVVEELLLLDCQVVVVDDGSVPSLLPLLPGGGDLYYLRHRVNLGQGAALQTGLEFARAKGGGYFITFDADGQHNAGDIGGLLQVLRSDTVDVVLGSRFLPNAGHNMPKGRKLLLQLARWVNFIFTGLLLTDAHNGLRGLNRKAAAAIHLRENRMAHATEILGCIRKSRLRYRELPVRVQYTAYSRGKGQGPFDSFRIFFDILLAKLFG